MKNDPHERPEKNQSFFRKPSDSDINVEPSNSQFQLEFKLNELGDFEDMIQNKSVKGGPLPSSSPLRRRPGPHFVEYAERRDLMFQISPFGI